MTKRGRANFQLCRLTQAQEKKRQILDNPGTILGLVGSPRKLGNCEVFIKAIARSMPERWTLRLVRIPSLHIEPCLACYGCVMDQPCPHRDDMEPLLHEVVQADVIVIATPVYFLGSHSMFKRILDRGFLFYTVLEKTYGKPCLLINFYGMKDRVGITEQTMMSLASFLGLDIKANVSIRAALPGEVLTDPRKKSIADALARKIFEKKKKVERRGCPFCGCRIVRMEKVGFRCTLCHGTFALDERGDIFKAKEGGIFGTPDHMLLHTKWLRGMKESFLMKRKEILRVTLPYKDDGDWVLP